MRASLVRGLAGRFRIQQADSGERAWELLLLDPSIGAVLSDLTMPGIDGFELLRRVRASLVERVRDLPFAVLSGSDDPAQRERAMSLGADRFVVKGDGVGELAGWLDERLAEGAAKAAAAEPIVPQRAAARHELPPSSGAPPAVAQSAAAQPSAADPTAARPPGARPPAAPPAATDRVVVAVPAVANPAAAGPAAASPATAVPAPATAVPAASAASAVPAPPVPEPIPNWYAGVIERAAAAGDAGLVLVRLHAPALDDLPARLRRGVRSADALRVESAHTAWLCVPATSSAALRLAMRFGLLAAGRLALADPGQAARVSLCLRPIDPAHPQDALVDLMASPPPAAAGGCTLRVLAGAWGPAWTSTLPWPAVRMLVG